MARIPMVTRTIQTTIVTIFCVSIEDRSTFEQTLTLPRTYKDDNKLMKVVEKALEGEPIKAVAIINQEVKEKLYGMTEQEFIKNAKVLPPRSTNDN